MRLLADASVDMAIVRALRAEDHEVAAVAEDAPTLADEEVLQRARSEERLLLTEDTDFGRLAAAAPGQGVVLLRFEARARGAIVRDTVALLATYGDRLIGRFAVLEPGRVRFRS